MRMGASGCSGARRSCGLTADRHGPTVPPATNKAAQRGARHCEACAATPTTEAAGLTPPLDVQEQQVPNPMHTWLYNHSAPEQSVHLQETKVDGVPIDVTVASRDIKAGETVLRIPDNLIVTLDRVFEDETVAEVLTTDKLSELACLTLYLMYEKKRGDESEWYSFIKELDRQRARSTLAAETPLLWSDEELHSYLQGSPVIAAVQERLASLRLEHEALDTVWFMSGSLFNKYPFDVPTEAFSFNLFRQAFAAVQSAVVHLRQDDVPLARRFALVPLGPPSLSYASNCKALFKHVGDEVVLTVDRDYNEGDRVLAWCGPQPNSRLLINYGIVDESNPHDKVSILATVPTASPLFQAKRRALEAAGLSTKAVFNMQRDKGLPEQLLPFLRVCNCTTAEELHAVDLYQTGDITESDGPILEHLVLFLQQRLARYARTRQQDKELLKTDIPVRQKVACRLLICEKDALHAALDAIIALPHAPKESTLQVTLEQRSQFVKLE